MGKYFKKTNGTIIEATENHDLQSLRARFMECNADGSELKKEAKKSKPKPNKKAGK